MAEKLTPAPPPEQTIVDVPALNVSPVCVEKLITAPVPVNVTVLLPRLIVRVLLLLDDRDAAVTLKLLVVKVPAERLMSPEHVRASAN